jgi:hypothetical protein
MQGLAAIPMIVSLGFRHRGEVYVALHGIQLANTVEANANRFGVEDIAIRDLKLLARLFGRKHVFAERYRIQVIPKAFAHVGHDRDGWWNRMQVERCYRQSSSFCLQVNALLKSEHNRSRISCVSAKLQHGCFSSFSIANGSVSEI